jgi:preprotein translocase subunit SecF
MNPTRTSYQGQPINFMKYPVIYFLISALFLVPGIFSLATAGLVPAIDFSGGSLIELQFAEPVTETQIRTEMPAEIEIGNLQSSGPNAYLMRTKPISMEQNELLKTSLAGSFGEVEELRFETIGPTLGAELLRKTIIAVILSAAVILAYVAYRFKNFMFGTAAIIAMIHDTLIVLGVFSLLGRFMAVEVDTLFVTAILTILAFSVHDSIVVYDRIRESLHLFPKAKFEDLINKAVNETLPRSINNSMTIIFMLLALWLLGGETTKWFVFALLVGTITGTYSSPFVAAPILVIWHRFQAGKK